jgi:hypothetical protein
MAKKPTMTIAYAIESEDYIKQNGRIDLKHWVVVSSLKLENGTKVEEGNTAKELVEFLVNQVQAGNKVDIQTYDLGVLSSFLEHEFSKIGMRYAEIMYHAESIVQSDEDVEEAETLPPMRFTELKIPSGETYYMSANPTDNEDSLIKFSSLSVLMPIPVSEIAEMLDFDLPKLKASDGVYKREDLLTECEVVNQAFNTQRVHLKSLLQTNGNVKALTMSGAAHKILVKTFEDKHGEDSFDDYFPKTSPYMVNELSGAYYGGFVYIKKQNIKPEIERIGCMKYTSKSQKPQHIGAGRVYDVNSEFPYVMAAANLPYGLPRIAAGKFEARAGEELYIQAFKAKFSLKPGGIATLPKKLSVNGTSQEIHTNYDLASQVLTLTNIDMKHFFLNYDVEEIEYIKYYAFQSKKGIFKEFVDLIAEEKIAADKAGDMINRQLSKLTMNSGYGWFARRTERLNLAPVFNEENDEIEYAKVKKESKPQSYYPMAIFIAAQAREVLFTGMYAAGDRLLYADTDSIHVEGDYPVDGIRVDDTEIGAWKHESSFTEAVFLREKFYGELLIDGTLDVKAAGVTDNAKASITKLEQINYDLTIPGNIMKTRVRGGILYASVDKRINR